MIVFNGSGGGGGACEMAMIGEVEVNGSVN
jgi:hypothetical protein